VGPTEDKVDPTKDKENTTKNKEDTIKDKVDTPKYEVCKNLRSYCFTFLSNLSWTILFCIFLFLLLPEGIKKLKDSRIVRVPGPINVKKEIDTPIFKILPSIERDS